MNEARLLPTSLPPSLPPSVWSLGFYDPSGLERGVEVLLFHEPGVVQLPLLFRIRQLDLFALLSACNPIVSKAWIVAYLESPQKARHGFVNFQQTDVFPNARPSPHPELDHGPFHCLPALLISLDPSLWPIDLDVGSEDLRPSVDDPCIAADDGAPGDHLPADLGAACRHDTLERKSGSRVQAEGFFDASVQIGETLRFRP